MKLVRHYLIGSDLDELERLEEKLERQGIPTPQIHVLSLDDTGTERHRRLHDVQSLMKKDLIRSGEYGALIGLAIALLVLAAAYVMGWHQTLVGWVPWVFLAIVCFGFFTWEGGLWGIQNLNVRFKRFEHELAAGRHVFFVDLEPRQEEVLSDALRAHPGLERAGTGPGAPSWLITLQEKLKRFFFDTMP